VSKDVINLLRLTGKDKVERKLIAKASNGENILYQFARLRASLMMLRFFFIGCFQTEINLSKVLEKEEQHKLEELWKRTEFFYPSYFWNC